MAGLCGRMTCSSRDGHASSKMLRCSKTCAPSRFHLRSSGSVELRDAVESRHGASSADTPRRCRHPLGLPENGAAPRAVVLHSPVPVTADVSHRVFLGGVTVESLRWSASHEITVLS